MHSARSSQFTIAPASSHLPRLVGTSPAMHRLEEAIVRVGHVDCAVLLTGETGSGKDEAARAIHAAGSRATRPFVAMNCAGIVGTLAESLLFGHEKGSFTSADETTTGAFRAANGGILFLDEIGELALDLQPKLLRALELREVVPVGATRPVKVDVQVIAATNRDLHREVGSGRFREDLLYRLNTIHVVVPPLRDRPDDIPLFAAHFAADCALRFDRPGWTLPDEAVQRFMEYAWPGNVRELRQTVLRIAIFEDRLEEILDELTAVRPVVEPSAAPASESTPASSETFNLHELRRDAVRRALAATAGHYGRAAALLGVSAKTMTKFAAEACPEQPAKRGRRRRKPLPR
ncbi:MAG: sigma-54 dependent transcriptional regulator [Pirellulales bacterium]